MNTEAQTLQVSEEDMDKLGLRDPVGWNASGFDPHAT